MSTLKQKAEQILQEKEEKISMGEFPNTQTIFDVTGTFEDLRNGGTPETVENPRITDMPADAYLEVVSNLNTNDVVVNSKTDIYTKVDYEPLAREIGLTADILKQGETILGIDGTVTPGIDTSDATADEYDVAMGKTAYVNGNKVIGAVPVYEEYTYTKMYPTVGSLTGNTLEILGTMDSHRKDTVLLRPEARVKLTPLQSDIANAAGLTADKIKIGETVLGVVGTYQGGEIKTQIDYRDNTIIVHCGVIVNALTSAINEGKIDASYKIDLNTSGMSTICLKLCDVAPNEVLINDTGTILTGCLGLAVNLESSYTALVFLAGDGKVEELGALDSHSSSPYYTTNMTVGDLIAALGSIGDVEIDISQDVIDSAWVYNEFRVIYYHFLNGSDLIKRGLLETTSDSMEIGEV